MPIYEYVCDSCGKVTEALQKRSDPPLTVCEHDAGRLSRLLSVSNVAHSSPSSGGWDCGKAGAEVSGCGSCGQPGTPCGMA